MSPHPRRRARLAWFALVIGAAGAFVGAGAAAPAQILGGAAEQGAGAYASETSLAYWTWQATQLWHLPSPPPSAVSAVAATPTVLPAVATEYAVGPATGGNLSVRWQIGETVLAPASTELELRFVAGLTGPVVLVRAFVETQPLGVTAPVVFLFYWDAGAFAPGSVTIETMQIQSLVCVSVGVCP